MKEGLKRSLAKTFSWKLINIIVDFVLVYFLTGKVVIAASFASISFVITLILYFLHERAWNRFSWGKH